jgi:hypothetical protein
MKDFMEQWKAWRFDNNHEKPGEYKRMQNTDKSTVNRDAAKQIMSEVSQQQIDLISGFLGRIPGERLSFDNIFQGKYRIMIPFHTPADVDEESPFGKIMQLFKNANATPDFANGTVSQKLYIPQIDQYREKTFRIGKWLNKLAFEKDRYRKLNVEKNQIQDKIRQGDFQDEDSKQKAADQLESAIEKRAKIKSKLEKEYGVGIFGFTSAELDDLVEFWGHKSEYYRQNPDAAEGESDKYSIVISRAPIDVLRMSDFQNIQSCHSPAGSYFQCAVAEAKGHGLVAYVVDNTTWNEAAKENGIDLQDEEIFEDDRRGIKGIRPLSRVRLRKFTYTSPFDGEVREMAVPEDSTYGKNFPKFVDTVRQWARESQPEVKRMMQEEEFPDWDSYTRWGGSYEDTDDDDALNYLLDPEDEIVPYMGGNVDKNTEDEEMGLEAEYENQVEQMLEYANQVLEHSSVHAEVEGDGDGGFYVHFSGGTSVDIPLEKMDSTPTYRDRDVQREIVEALSNMNVYLVEEVDFNEYGNTFSVSLSANMGDYSPTPDGLEEFIDAVRSEWDQQHDTIRLVIERVLASWGYMKPSAYYQFASDLEELEDEAYENFKVEVDSDSVYISQREDHDIYIGDYIRPLARLTGENDGARVLMKLRGVVDTSAFKRNFIEQIVNGARKSLERQLNLPGIDDTNEIFNLIAPAGFQANIMVEDNANLSVSIKVALEPDDEDEEVLVAKAFVEWLDKNYYKVMKAAEVTVHKAIGQYFEQLQDKSDKISEVQKKIEQARALVQEEEPYQKEMRKKHPKWKKNLIGKGGNKYKAAPFKLKVSMKRSKSAPPGAGGQ